MTKFVLKLIMLILVPLGSSNSFGQDPAFPPTKAILKRQSEQYKSVAGQMLQLAASTCTDCDSADVAAIDYGIGFANQSIDMSQASEWLKRSFSQAFQLTDSDRPGISTLQVDIVSDLAKVDPIYLRENLPQAQPARDQAIYSLISIQIKHKKVADAEQLYEGLYSAPNVFLAARLLLENTSNPTTRAAVFSHALRAYEALPSETDTLGYPEDMSSLIVRYWRLVPGQLVISAINRVIQDAEVSMRDESKRIRLQVESPIGHIQFSSATHFRVFEFLPILEELDPTEAATLKGRYSSVASDFEKYNNGLSDIDPDFRGGKSNHQRATYTIVRDGMSSDYSRNAEAAGSFDEAIGYKNPTERIQALSGFAEQGNVAARLRAIREILKTRDADPRITARIAVRVAQTALSMKQERLSLDCLAWGYLAAERLLKSDADPENPNRAIRIYWPSTQAYRDLLAVHAKISLPETNEAMSKIPDHGVRALERVMFASAILKTPVWANTSPSVIRNK